MLDLERERRDHVGFGRQQMKRRTRAIGAKSSHD
jgi:hypothetical protein